MDCPRCDASLTTFTLEGRRAVVCERCEYVGIPTDHHADGAEDESWDEALARFYGQE